jgi:hypothetical protein
MHKSATECNETVGKWCKNKHGVSKIIDTLETYQRDGARTSGASVQSPREQIPRSQTTAGGRVVVASRIGLGTGSSRDGRQHSVGLDPEANAFQTRQRILGLRRKQTRLQRGKEPAEATC